MTITATAHSATFAGNGVTTVFPLAFPFIDDTDLTVNVVTALGATNLQSLGLDYTVAGAGDAGGGSVTMLVAPITGSTLEVTRGVPITQDMDLQSQGPYLAETVEAAFDKLTMIAQQLMTEAEVDAAIATAIAAVTAGTYNPVTATGSTTARTLENRFAEVYHVEDWGALGDGSTDDTAAINLAAAAAGALGVVRGTPGRTYKISSKITFLGPVDMAASILSTAVAGIAVQVGDGTLIHRSVIRLPHVVQTNKTWSGDTGIRLVNVLESEIYIPHIQNFALGLETYGQAQGFVYNNVYVGHLDNNKVNLRLNSDATGWSNENNFIGGRYSHNSSEGTNVAGVRHILASVGSANIPNNNVFLKPSIEGNVPEYHVEVIAGAYNILFSARWEATTPKCRFDAAFDNQIFYGYNVHSVVVTNVNGAVRNSRFGTRNQRIEGTDAAAMMALTNNFSGNIPALAVYAAGADIYDAAILAQWVMGVTEVRSQFRAAGDTASRFEILHATGKHSWGDGTNPVDTILYRSGVGALQTTGALGLAGANGESFMAGSASELLTLATGATTTDTSANLLPAGAIIDSVVTRVTTTITTAVSFSVGDPTTAARFSASAGGMSAGSTRVGLDQWNPAGAAVANGPSQAAAAKVRITTNANPGAGAIRITVFYRVATAPTS